MDNFVFQNRTKILFGKDQVDNVGDETAALGKNVLLVTGGGSVHKSGLYKKITASLNKAGLLVTDHSGIAPNPEIESVRKGADICKEKKIDLVLAVGGGSVVDAAKTIALAAVYDGDPWDFFSQKIKPSNPLPLGVVLTLSATGSEANGNAVITNPKTGKKLPMYHPDLYPAFSILDPTLTFSVPADQTAYGAVDIMSHVFEQYFHDIKATSIQDGFAETVMRAVIRSAPVAKNRDNYNARADLMWASTLALYGLIGTGAKGDWTCHMLEHELSAKYGIAHGAGLAVVFTSWMRHVVKRKTGRFKQYAVNVWGVDPSGKSDLEIAKQGVEMTRAFFKDILGVGVTLKDYGIDDTRIEEMANSTATIKKGALGGLDVNDLVEILKNASK
jgi:hypothetical protein